MEISSARYSFIMQKNKQESWQQFYMRSQAICTVLDRKPALIAEFENLQRMSHYYVAHRFMECEYNEDIHAELRRLFLLNIKAPSREGDGALVDVIASTETETETDTEISHEDDSSL